ncbi:NAD(P)H-dependent oxidoreductase [Mycoplasma feriruminatoris]|uniref:NAD(P)H-dependent oxidoreductase n=1 Tax=Mycoplasma feriruminatoris TaxID=1179777 RepID=A0ABY8HXR3_9MOLU|nr:NAD(P)H-dependent oxidoreductase [Mycoplasma feriruminatoris]UKS54247.1 nitroreductase family protein [Mycoplasma feriruminatoris]WFQ90300.1 Putative NAD(P)H nitroreductase YfkO [Mycoplasma feriruminatoris]WFQ91125.1 NAD(P)H-dependent oxidoreductase [Mycoplasma feriruminatoris]WFQ91945.1 Putative NAD(P)H nitroreductase YfkO [Mycoplasma feriruminatoris]WFQ93630.1 NAD(P)H-dependent oxidoreductase [Mycoplasma feriruminatoris]
MQKEYIKELMLNRKSARDFDPIKSISDQDLEIILTSMRMAPSAFNLMNLRLLIIDRNCSFKPELASLFYNQLNFINADKVILFVSDKTNKILNYTIDKTVNKMFNETQVEIANKFKNNLVNATNRLAQTNELDHWSKTTAHIAAGIGTVACASLNIDSCIIGGFNAKVLENFFIEKNYLSEDEQIVLTMSLGYMNKSLKPKPKIRIDEEEYITFIK